MILNLCRLLIALALAACASHSRPQDSLESAEPESEVDAEDAPQFTTVAPPAPTEKAAEVRECVVRSEAARSRGDIQTQVAELRRAHALAQGRDSNVVNLLAGALALTGTAATVYTAMAEPAHRRRNSHVPSELLRSTSSSNARVSKQQSSPMQCAKTQTKNCRSLPRLPDAPETDELDVVANANP